MEKAKIIAELCCNHMGDLNLAKDMIIKAKENGADVVKFQKRDIDEWKLRKPEIYLSPHKNPKNSFGRTYEEHRRFLEFSFEQHVELKKICDNLGVEYSSSVWDIKSAKQIISLNPSMIKIASACNQRYDLLEYICDNFKGEIHVSLGMSLYSDIDSIVNFFIKKGRNKDLILYACTSGYPVEASDVCLLEITRLLDLYGNKVKGIGFSGHYSGIVYDMSAYTLGAKYIERHFTLNKNFKGTDQKLSLEPNELKSLRNNLDDLSLALNFKNDSILNVEKENREKLKW